MAGRVGKHLRGNVVAYVALFIALGGTAYALERNSVKSKHIANGQVKPADTNLVKFDQVVAEETTTGSVNDPLSGPKLEVKVKEGDLLSLHARAEGKRVSGTGQCWAALTIDLPEGEDDSTVRVLTYDADVYLRKYVTDGFSGTFVSGVAEAREIPIKASGTARLSFEYQSESGAAVCAYKERALYAGVGR